MAGFLAPAAVTIHSCKKKMACVAFAERSRKRNANRSGDLSQIYQIRLVSQLEKKIQKHF